MPDPIRLPSPNLPLIRPVVGALLLGLALAGPAAAQDADPAASGEAGQDSGAAATTEDAAQQVAPDAETGGAAGAQAEAEAVTAIEGFRSAQFGMTEDQVLDAIRRDFDISGDQVTREPNPLEKTTALVVTVPDLIPDAGPARIAYILGYRSKALIQVNVIWGSLAGESTPVEDLVGTAGILQSYFAQRTYAPGTVFANVALPDGTVVLFTGSDEEGRQATLTLSGAQQSAAPAGGDADASAPADADGDAAAASEAGEGATDQAAPDEAAATPAAGRQGSFLRLSYVASPGEPDVFRLQPGDF